MALDADIAVLMTNTVSWEAYTGQNVAGENTYAAAKTKSCWIEEARPLTGGVVLTEHAGETTADPSIDVFLDANDPDVVAMRMEDRFTVAAGVEAGSIPLVQNPKFMTIFYGQYGEPWVKSVRF